MDTDIGIEIEHMGKGYRYWYCDRKYGQRILILVLLLRKRPLWYCYRYWHCIFEWKDIETDIGIA